MKNTYIESTTIYASWMIRKCKRAITNSTLSFLNTEFVNKLKEIGNYEVQNIGKYDDQYFKKTELGIMCKETVSTKDLMNIISQNNLDSYLDICKTMDDINNCVDLTDF